jgi:hypothetical protein
LFLSGIFYKTFDEDARFLSDKYWFKIKEAWWYETIWFPKNVLEKYLLDLEQKNIWYIVFEKNWDKQELNKKFEWWKKLEYFVENIIYLDKNSNNQKKDFKSFLFDLSILIKKYI